MPHSSDELKDLKSRMKASWMAGDFGQIALYSAKAAEEFVDRLHIQPGARVLDVACGTGNVRLRAWTQRPSSACAGACVAPGCGRPTSC